MANYSEIINEARRTRQLVETIYYRTESNEVRAWRNQWFSDQFEVLSHDDFAILKKHGLALGFTFVEVDHD